MNQNSAQGLPVKQGRPVWTLLDLPVTSLWCSFPPLTTESCRFKYFVVSFTASWCLVYPFAILGRLQAHDHLFIYVLFQELEGMTCLRSPPGVLLALEYRVVSHNPVQSPRGLFWCYDGSSLHSFYLAGRRGFRTVWMCLFLLPVFSICSTSVSVLNLELLMKLRSSEWLGSGREWLAFFCNKS